MVVTQDEARKRLVALERGVETTPPADRLAEVRCLRDAGVAELGSALDVRLTIAEAAALSQLDREPEAIELLERAIGAFAGSADEPTLKAVAYALVMRVEMLVAAGLITAAEGDTRHLSVIFAQLTPGTQRHAQVGLMLVDAAFWMFAVESRTLVAEITDQFRVFSDSDSPDEQRLAAAGAVLEVLVRGQAGKLDGLGPYVQRIGRFGAQVLPVLDRVQLLLGEPPLNLAYHGVVEMLRAAVLDSLGRRSDALAALQRADQIYKTAGINEGRRLVAVMREEWE